MRPIVPRRSAGPAQPEIRLVHQRGRLQGVTGPLRPEMPRGDGPQLRVNQRQKPLERAVIPLLPRAEILGDWFDSLMIQGRPKWPPGGITHWSSKLFGQPQTPW
jgi:hypothetical protein